VITLDQVTKRFGTGATAVDNLSLTVDEGELVVFVGPSGCGKTTTMKMVNRLIDPTSGRILIAGRDVAQDDPVAVRRGIGYVIQQIGLFPHQTIGDNVATVPRLLGWDRTRIRSRVGELLDLVGLPAAEYAKRYPHQLSGGQRQRVGVARALGADPPVLLMDEPFGAIDPVTRDRLQQEFLRLQAELRKTVIFVTHDIEEAVLLGDRIAVLRQGGVLEQYDTPADVLGRPATPFVSSFVGADRGLKRLSVTPIVAEDLEHPPVVEWGTSLASAAAAMSAAGSSWAVVVQSGQLRGYIGRRDCSGDGVVGDRARRMEAWVPAGASLKRGFATMLGEDAGWVAVLGDDGSYLGVLTPESLHAALRRSVAAADAAAAAPTG
jgi:osmoprotectant transport system ATP-binding protein